MSIEATITQLYLKVEGIFREVKTGFPEGLKQYLLNQCHDVYVWIGVHHMALSALAVSTVVGLSLGAYYSFKKKLSRELTDASDEITKLNSDLEQTRKDLYAIKHKWWAETDRASTLELSLSQSCVHAESLLAKNQLAETYVSVLENQNHELTALVHSRDEALSAYVETVEELKSALDACESETSAALTRVDELEEDKHGLVEHITELEDRESELETERDEALDEVSDLEDRVEELEDDVENLESTNRCLIDGVEAWTVRANELHEESRERQGRVVELEAIVRDYQQLDELAKAA